MVYMNEHNKEKCTKTSFKDEEAAEYYIKKLKKTSRRTVKPVASYLCPTCLNWHLTSSINHEDMRLIYKEREIENLKIKIANLRKENEGIRSQNESLKEKLRKI